METTTLINGDCIQAMSELEEESVELIVTDPPYNLGTFAKNRGTGFEKMRSNYFAAAGWDDMAYEDWKGFMDVFFENAARVMKKGGSMVVFMSIIKVETVIALAQKHGFYYKTTGIWHKKNPMPRNMKVHFVNSTEPWIYFVYKAKTGTFNNDGLLLHDFVETPVAPASERKYGKRPTQKPVALMKHFVDVLSNPGDTVLDPFMGSGSTGVAVCEGGYTQVHWH